MQKPGKSNASKQWKTITRKEKLLLVKHKINENSVRSSGKF